MIKITTKFEIPKDFKAQMQKALEKKLAEHIRMDGVSGVTVKIDRTGQAVFSGSDESLKKVEKSLKKLK